MSAQPSLISAPCIRDPHKNWPSLPFGTAEQRLREGSAASGAKEFRLKLLIIRRRDGGGVCGLGGGRRVLEGVGGNWRGCWGLWGVVGGSGVLLQRREGSGKEAARRKGSAKSWSINPSLVYLLRQVTRGTEGLQMLACVAFRYAAPYRCLHFNNVEEKKLDEWLLSFHLL